MRQLEIRKALTADVNDITDLMNEVLNRKLSYGDMAWGQESFTANEIKKYLEEVETFVAEHKSKLVGSVSITWEDERNWGQSQPNAGYIHRLSALNQNPGVGAKLLDFAEKYVSSKGLKFARLDCDQANRSLCQYYLYKGYHQVGAKSLTEGAYQAALFEKALD